ncbi:hypothetical protein [Paenibacillus favisporus]|uniref:hypothetical protein n=1 Tax=Paenibacillus favisporus TaxID=221028 RepID=UPI003D2E04CE
MIKRNLSLSTLIFILSLLLISIGLLFSFIWFPKKEIYLSLTSLGGSIAGGWITLIGVKLTIQKSDEEKFIQTFMDKIIAINNSIDILQEFRDEDCFEFEGEDLWSIVLMKSEKFELVYKNINTTIEGEIAYRLLKHTLHLEHSSTNDFEKYLNTHPRVQIFGRETILNSKILSLIQSIDIIIDELQAEEERLVKEYSRIKKKRIIV